MDRKRQNRLHRNTKTSIIYKPQRNGGMRNVRERVHGCRNDV